MWVGSSYAATMAQHCGWDEGDGILSVLLLCQQRESIRKINNYVSKMKHVVKAYIFSKKKATLLEVCLFS